MIFDCFYFWRRKNYLIFFGPQHRTTSKCGQFFHGVRHKVRFVGWDRKWMHMWNLHFRFHKSTDRDMSQLKKIIRGLCLMKLSSETLQNLPYFWNKKTQNVFFIFHFEQLWICNSGCSGLYRHIWTRASAVKNPKLLEMKKNIYLSFLIPKI